MISPIFTKSDFLRKLADVPGAAHLENGRLLCTYILNEQFDKVNVTFFGSLLVHFNVF